MKGNTGAVDGLRIVVLAAAFTTIGVVATSCGGGAEAREVGKGIEPCPIGSLDS